MSCGGGSLVALQTTEAVVPGSNPASLTVKNSEDRQSHCVYCTNLWAERKTSPRGKKKKYLKQYVRTIKFKLCCRKSASRIKFKVLHFNNIHGGNLRKVSVMSWNAKIFPTIILHDKCFFFKVVCNLS